MKKIAPQIIILAICLITINLWIITKSDYSIFFQEPQRALSQITALLGIVLMALSLLLSTRLKFIEEWFGGLDRVYTIHHILGSLSFVLIMHHPLFLIFKVLPNLSAVSLYILPLFNLSYALGILALYAMIFSFIFMVFIKLPYHLWKITHKVLGASFLLGSIHSLIITSDISGSIILKIWILIFIFIGIISSVYIIFLYRHIGPYISYKVDSVKRTLDIIDIYISPEGQKSLTFNSGQFVYVSFKNASVGREMHPFSISSANHENILRLSVKVVGDYTLRLPLLNIGDRVDVYGPYGKFHPPQDSKPINVIWIGAGIGVTPFLSLLHSEEKTVIHKSIYFFYVYRNRDDGIYLSEIEQKTKIMPHVKFINWSSIEMGRLNAENISRYVNLTTINYILICGPKKMMFEIKKQLINLGVDEDKILFENFSLI